MDYRDLLAFVAVARYESYSHASEELHLAQSALSRRVARLERQLGVPLLERHPRGVRVTQAGSLVAERFMSIEGELRRLQNDVQALQTGIEDVYVAMPQGAARLFTIPVVARFQGLHPKAKLHVSERESVYNRESALKGEVAFALAYNARPDAALVIVPLLIERVFVIGPLRPPRGSHYPEAYSLDDLAHLPLILPGRPHGYRSIVEEATARVGLQPDVILEVNGIATSLAMVQQGLGFTLATHSQVQSFVEAGVIVGIPIASPHCEVTLSLVYRADAPMPHLLLSLKRIIEEVSASIEPSAYSRPMHD